MRFLPVSMLAVLIGASCTSDPVTEQPGGSTTSGPMGPTTGAPVSSTDAVDSTATSTGLGSSTATSGSTTDETETDVDPGVGVTLRRTSHGIVHVSADDYFGIGYGVGYAYTQDNRCLLVRRIEEVNGRLAAQLGADAPVTHHVHDVTVSALQSDRFYRGWFDPAAIEAGFAAGAPEVVELAEGYAAGVNRYLDDHPGSPACEVELTAELTAADLYRLWVAAATVASGESLIPLVAASPPDAAMGAEPPSPAPWQGPPASRPPVGSNAWAIGEDATTDGTSLHLYNPHFPWAGIERLYMVHVTIPGQLDVMGAALGGFALPAAGFSRQIAWGLTFSNASRYTVAELALTGDPLSYTVDGAIETIEQDVLSIDVLGEPKPRAVPFYRAQSRPVIDAPSFFLPWTASTAFAVQDVNATNTRLVEQLLRIAQASHVQELRDSLEELQGIPWSYVVASDSQGEVLFGDISAVPDVSTEHVTECVTTPTGSALLSFGIVVLDGSRAECGWSGLLPPEQLPGALRSDYVANSNNSHELPNLGELLTGFSPVLGLEGAGLSLRASLGLHMIEDRLTGADGRGPGFTAQQAQEVFFEARNRGGELLVDGIVADCQANPVGEHEGMLVDLGPACSALAGWDRRNTVASPGAAVFRGLWMALPDPSLMFEVPASLAAPLATPTGYTADPSVRAAVRDALARVSVSLGQAGVALDAPWGDVHSVLTPSGSVAMPGGLQAEGIFDAMVSVDGFYTFDGWVSSLSGVEPESLYGASYLHVVTLGDGDPQASGLLPYSQATEARSPWFLDQVARWSSNDWMVLPFTNGQIEADPELVTLEL
ncbi:MAG: penicillin acylase family protein [Myxococcota bacterium]